MVNINVALHQWSINFFDKKSSGSSVKNKIISNKELPEEFRKPIIRKFKKRKVQWPFIENIGVPI